MFGTMVSPLTAAGACDFAAALASDQGGRRASSSLTLERTTNFYEPS